MMQTTDTSDDKNRGDEMFFFSLFEFCIVVVAYLMSSGEFEESWTPEGE